MANLTSTPSIQLESDSPAWDGLQRAIIASSGFQSWCAETAQVLDARSEESHEQLVMAYLRETLETLAY
ncbi:MAG: hypothetical protein VKJ64_16160 [Leptolyngbyaceae bacterium]|nr:hypothetical protein [Leptolyngbyaceae bacterium]